MTEKDGMFNLVEYRRKILIQDFLITTFHKHCYCRDGYGPCRRCRMLTEAEELFPREYRACESVVARMKGDRK